MFNKATELPFSQQSVFNYHCRPGAIDRLIPPWERVRLVKRSTSLEVGAEVILRQSIGPIKKDWLARHTVYDPPHRFRDEQISGPFQSWIHDHIFEPTSESSCRLIDSVQYQLPLAPLSNVASNWVKRQLSSMFEYRHRITKEDLHFAQYMDSVHEPNKTTRVAVSGSSGMIGRRICAIASVCGIDVVRILRPGSTRNDPEIPCGSEVVFESGTFSNPDLMEGLDAVIHLGGYGIAESRWTAATKKKIKESRVESTKSLVDGLRKLKRPPRKFVCASGIGAYGDRGDAVCSDSDPDAAAFRGASFLEEVSRDWEGAARLFSDVGTVCIGRLAMVLHPLQGALAKMMPLFKLGLGGRIGDGKQYWSWIHIDDAAAAFVHIALNAGSAGVYNISSPEPCTNSDFTDITARQLNRWACLPAPDFGLRMMVGQMADELLLASTRAVPTRLEQESFPFRASSLKQAYETLLPQKIS
ncbi:TIGR01777 family oxidoreductase [Pirellulaceae bacterium SH449]